MSVVPVKERKERFLLLPDKSGAANPWVLNCLPGWMTGVLLTIHRVYATPTFVPNIYRETSPLPRTYHNI